MEEAGAIFITISPQTAEKSRALIEKRRFGFEILRDPGLETAAAYGLRWEFPEDLKQIYLQFGIDLAEVPRVRKLLHRSPESFRRRCFTDHEWEYAHRFSDPAGRLAARFAGKEAVMKSLGTGWRRLRWTDIEITGGGRPRAVLTGRAAIRADIGLGNMRLLIPMLSDIQELEAAFRVHKSMGSYLGGVHLELTGENVTECTGGARDLSDEDLKRSYKSTVDPRLNYEQSLEIAMLIVEKHERDGS